MKFVSLSAIALAVVLAASPALAQQGILEKGCPTGQTFTAGAIAVSGAFTRAMLPNARTAGGYFVITNSGDSADRLTGASSAAAASVTIHQMKMNGDVMEMSAVEGGLDIPAGGSVALTPSGYHLMMSNMPAPFKQGACVQLTLHFAQAGDLEVAFNVGSVAQSEAPSDRTMPTDAGPVDAGNMDQMNMDHMEMDTMPSMDGM